MSDTTRKAYPLCAVMIPKIIGPKGYGLDVSSSITDMSDAEYEALLLDIYEIGDDDAVSFDVVSEASVIKSKTKKGN